MQENIEAIRVLAEYKKMDDARPSPDVAAALLQLTANILDVSPDRAMELLQENAREISIINAPD